MKSRIGGGGWPAEFPDLIQICSSEHDALAGNPNYILVIGYGGQKKLFYAFCNIRPGAGGKKSKVLLLRID